MELNSKAQELLAKEYSDGTFCSAAGLFVQLATEEVFMQNPDADQIVDVIVHISTYYDHGCQFAEICTAIVQLNDSKDPVVIKYYPTYE